MSKGIQYCIFTVLGRSGSLQTKNKVVIYYKNDKIDKTKPIVKFSTPQTH